MTYQIVDIETAPDPNALIPECPDEYLHQGIRENFKPETRLAYEEKNRAAWPVERRSRGALDWRLGVITCVSVTKRRTYIGVNADWIDVYVVTQGPTPDGDVQERDWLPSGVRLRVEGQQEATLLSNVWHELSANPVAGFAIRDFDWPWILGRSAVHGISPSVRLRAGRYGSTDLVDWADVLTWYGAFPRKGWTLSDYARHFNLPYQPWGDGVGAVEAWEEGRIEDLVRHSVMDGLTTLALHERFLPMLGAMG